MSDISTDAEFLNDGSMPYGKSLKRVSTFTYDIFAPVFFLSLALCVHDLCATVNIVQHRRADALDTLEMMRSSFATLQVCPILWW